ncbi:MAG: hypothetical protein JSV18_02435 [Candidatus Bathyarchaeota archaeon]|nr:MAG: hypothetical protein JSV18_02435 [Candidatus Bathyarchaeota archaeon]
MTPDIDPYTPILHSYMWKEPIPMPYPINTAGAEDSPFITPCGDSFYFFFTPDPNAPLEEQLLDGVTGIYQARRSAEGWEEPSKVALSDGLSLDGCPYVGDGEIWFCSARSGNYKGVDFWVAQIQDGEVTEIRNAGERLNTEIEVGELHVTSDGAEIYFHSDMPGGKGDRDIWVTRMVDGEWQDPENVEAVNSEASDSLPFVTLDGEELWLTKWYMGYPAVYRSKRIGGEWSTPELIISQFAAEPTLDAEGNIYFAHHFIQEGVMLEADIYVAYARSQVDPLDKPDVPARGYLMGVLPIPAGEQTFEESYSSASQFAELVPIWGRPTPFYELAGELAGSWGETFLEGYTRGNGMPPLVHISFMGPNMTLSTPPGLEDATLSDPEWRRAYINAILNVLEASKPLYLSLGNEVNRWHEIYGLDPQNGFQHYVSLYEEAYDAVKALSPETFVFCTFAREIVSENREADLGFLEMFNLEKLDLLVITSYPHSLRGVNSPDDIPDDYYTEVADHLPGKPFGFSEVAWPSKEDFGGEQGQAEFLTQLVGRLTEQQELDLRLLSWSWLADLTEDDHIGLIGRDGTEKSAFTVWNALFSEG